MTWNATCPIGSQSVKANRPVIQANMTYIETVMGNTAADLAYTTSQYDHFWDVGVDFSGHHRFIKSPAYTVGGNPADPGAPADGGLGTSIDGILYLKTTNNRAEWFHRNVDGIYQAVPSFLQGTHVVTSGYTNLVAVPLDVYGDIFMWAVLPGNNSQRRYRTVTGFFRSGLDDAAASIVDAWALVNSAQGDDTANGLKFGNGSDASGLNIQVRAEDATSNLTWNYRITYRAI